jgi:hypothetical protein
MLVRSGIWFAVVSMCYASIVKAASGPVRKARSSTLPLACVLTPLLDVYVKRLWFSQSMKGFASSEDCLVYKSHLRCRRLKLLARNAEAMRVCKRLVRSVIVFLAPSQLGGALYTLIIVTRGELQAWICRKMRSWVVTGCNWSACNLEPLQT